MTVIVRPASREDIEAFSDETHKPTVKAYAMEKEGEILGLGGIAFSGGFWIAFCSLKPEAKHHKIALARGAIRFFKNMRDTGIRYIYADLNEDELRALDWLYSLGFEADPRGSRLYRWKA